MKILIVNKFLKLVGGSETYIFNIASGLQELGHEVQFFGMYDENNTCGNSVKSYTRPFDFHTKSIKRILYPFKIIYSMDARRKIRLVLNDYKPDVVHLNLFNFQITPSVIYEIISYSKMENRRIRIVYTAHDYQLICPNYKLLIPSTMKVCERCVDGSFIYCTANRCIHNSLGKSLIGTAEAFLYSFLGAYRYIDAIICPSAFMAQKLAKSKVLGQKLFIRHNPMGQKDIAAMAGEGWTASVLPGEKAEQYMLYFGRYSAEKGFSSLVSVCRELKDVEFKFAGRGKLANLLEGTANIKNLGFLSGSSLYEVIRGARAAILPSEWYENDSVACLEAQMAGVPIIAANIGGIPERVADNKTALLFESGNANDLKDKIFRLWNDDLLYEELAGNCRRLGEFIECESSESYCGWLTDTVYRND